MPVKPNSRPESKSAPKPRSRQEFERIPSAINGNLTRDPDLRYTSTARSVASFAIAESDRTFNPETGKWEDGEVTFHECTAWGTLAENLCACLAKGDRVVLIGYFQDEEYIARDGELKRVTKFTARDAGASMLWSEVKVIRAQRA